VGKGKKSADAIRTIPSFIVVEGMEGEGKKEVRLET